MRYFPDMICTLMHGLEHKMMKHIVMILVLMLALIGCGDSDSDADGNANASLLDAASGNEDVVNTLCSPGEKMCEGATPRRGAAW